jgi:3-oxoacyl-[acyl-carrier protein] reductase
MAERGWGRVVNVIGVAAHQPNPTYLSGGAINAALLSVTKSLAKEYAAAGVTVNAINPGPINTARRQRLMAERAKMSGRSAEQEDKASVAGVPMGRAGTPEEIGAMVAFLCSTHAAFTSGSLIDIDGAMSLGL